MPTSRSPVALVPDVLRANPGYRRLFLSEAVSSLGTSISTLAFPLLVLASGGNAVQAGAIATAVLGTRLAFRLPAGALVDRWNPRAVMVSTDLVRLLAVGSLPVVALGGRVPFAQMLAVAVIEGLAGALFGPAVGVMTRDVTAPGHLGEAMGLSQMVSAGTSLLGPAAGGALFMLDPMLPFAVDAGSYAVSALLLWRISHRPDAEPEPDAGRGGITAGVHWLLRTRKLLVVLVFSGVINLVGGAMDIMIVLDLRRHGASADVTGLILSCAGIGAVAGSVVALPLTRRLSTPAVLLGLGVMWSAGFAALAVSFTPVTAAVVLTGLMVLSPSAGVVVGTAILARTPRHLIGRVNAATSMLLMGLAVLGPITAGTLVEVTGAAGSWWVLALATGALTAVSWRPMRAAWAEDEVGAGGQVADPPKHDEESGPKPDDRSPVAGPGRPVEPEVVAHLGSPVEPEVLALLGSPAVTEIPADPYAWLEDATDPQTRRWSADREVEFARAAAGWSQRERFAAALRALDRRQSASSAPRPAGERLFLQRRECGAEHPVVVVLEPDGTHRVLLDPQVLDESGHTTLENWHPSPDGRRLAYQVAAGGTENSRLSVLDVDTGRMLDGPIDRVRNSTVAWLPDGSGFYYVRRIRGLERRVQWHQVGTSPDQDVIVFGEGRDATQHYAVRIAPDGRTLVISASTGSAPGKEVWLADLDRSGRRVQALRVVQDGNGVRTRLFPRSDGCYVLTDLAAPRGRLARCSVAAPDPKAWVALVGEDPEAVLTDFVVLDRPDLDRPVLLVGWTRHAVAELTVHDHRDGRRLASVPLPQCCSVGPLRAQAEAAAQAWFTVTGFGRPSEVYRFDAVTGRAEPWADPLLAASDPGSPPGRPVTAPPLSLSPSSPSSSPADGNRPEVRTRQLTYPSADGTLIRMFVMSAGDPDRPVPTILTAYGGFGTATVPSYAPDVHAWVLAGGVYAVASIRGGGEQGQDWHRAGMRAGKQNSIDDLNAAADHLVALGWTTPSQLGIWGASNGGLVVGAALTQRPAAYAAVACLAPLLDMARYQLSGLGPSWVGEYGDANDPEQLRWLLSYSPYHHVRAGQVYPAVLFMVFDGDTRVDPLHARKMAARLQDTAGTAPVLFRLERHAGHGTRSTSSKLGLLTDLLAFFADRLGLG
jgi:prolyl oligopeptidase